MMAATSFHHNVFAVRPTDQIKPNTFWVGVLDSHLRPSINHKKEDFLWIKCHGTITVRKVLEQYMSKRAGETVFLKHGSMLPDQASTMRELDQFGDRTIAFEAINVADLHTRMAADRTPLQPTNNHQVSMKADPKAKSSKVKNKDAQNENIQPAPGCLDPFVAPHQSSRPTPPTSSNPKAPAARPTTEWKAPIAFPNASNVPFLPNSRAAPPKSTTPDAPNPPNTSDASNRPSWATSNGFLCYSDEWRVTFEHRNPGFDPSKPQPNPIKAQRVYLHVPSADQINNILLKNWLQFTPIERERFENAAKRSASGADVKFEPIKTDVIVKDVLPIGNAGDFPSGLEDQRQHVVQIQALLKDATPELLESSVAQGVKLLDQLKAPLLDKGTDATDAAQWLQQLGISKDHSQN